MTLSQAGGFLAAGVVLGLLPQLAPGWCPPDGINGTSARIIWLHTMSWCQVGLAGCCFARRALGVLAMMMKYEPLPRAARRGEAPGGVARRAQPPAMLPVPAELLDQPRAA